MPPKEKTEEYTLVIVGSGGVGKSCLTVKFLKDEFLTEYDPTIEENYRKKIVLEGKEITLDIIDTAGQQEYTTLRDSHLRNGQGFLLCYAINDDTSFNEIKELHASILRLKDNSTKTPFVVAGCKSDLADERKVDSAVAKQWADSIKSPFIETSAKIGTNVPEAFNQLVTEIRKLNQTTSTTKTKEAEGGGCCVIV